MVLSAAKMQEIRRKAELGIPLYDNSNKEANKFYQTVVEVKRKAALGIPLVGNEEWKKNLYVQYGGSPIQQGDGVVVTGPVGSSPVTQTGPVIDSQSPVIVDNTNNSPTTPIGSGVTNPVNKLELNSLVAVAIGFVFVRGAFKLLTKLF